MGSFDEKNAYQRYEDSDGCYEDGREIELLHFVYDHPFLSKAKGSPRVVLDIIDEYARKNKYLMNVGQDKGKLVSDYITEAKPQIMVELGGYVGYSAVLFGDVLRREGGKRYYSLERNPESAAVILSLVNLAGLNDIVKVVVGPSARSLLELHTSGELQHIDLLFIDHDKGVYLQDLKICEQLRLVAPGSLIIADNVILYENPPYTAYVRASVDEKRSWAEKDYDLSEKHADWIAKMAAHYTTKQGSGDIGMKIAGDPDLQYESKLIHSFEPTGDPDGLEITRCVAKLHSENGNLHAENGHQHVENGNLHVEIGNS